MIKRFFSFIWPWSSYWNIRKTSNKLVKAIENKQKKRVKLAKKIRTEVRQYLGIGKDDKSEYIPPDYKTRIRTRAAVYEKFGDEMRTLDVKLDNKLKLS